MDAVRHFQGLAGPILWLFMLVFAVWMLWQANLDISWTIGGGGVKFSPGERIYQIAVAVGLTVGPLATLMLNFPDFARSAPARQALNSGTPWGTHVTWTALP